MHAVAVENLSKTYQSGKKAVHGISFTIKPGEIFGFLGPNGAGKTTTVKLLGGMLVPTEGHCRVFNLTPNENPAAIHKISGFVTEHAQMYDNMTGIENLLFYASIFGMSEKAGKDRATELLDRLSLTEAGDQKLVSYSTGMRQRLSLARAMLHSPKILFLDEPTSGLDPESAKNVNTLIRHLAAEYGTTVFLCTHQLRYAQEICTCYGLISSGTLLACGTLEELRNRVTTHIPVTIHADYVPENLHLMKKEPGIYTAAVTAETEIPNIVKAVVESGGKIYHVSAGTLTLEEIYFRFLEKNKQKEEHKCKAQ